MNEDNLIRTVQDAIDSVHFSGFEKGDLIFRGQNNSSWEILPSLFRKYPNINHASLYEAASIKSLLLNIKSPYVNSYDPIELLMTSQHFDQPTRLLDWTFDILVGLFFSCYDPKGQQEHFNGRLILTEKIFFKIFKTNSKEQEEYKTKLIPEKIHDYSKRFNINDIYILEPLIKNPRMRVQEGCFMFFPWKYYNDDKKLLTLNKYIKEQRKSVDDFNLNNKDNLEHQYIFIAYKDIAKECKASILKELELKYDISEKSLFIESKYSLETKKHFTNLKLDSELKLVDLLKKFAPSNSI